MSYFSIIGTGSYLPIRVVTNDDLSHELETNDEWIRTRTGIKQRHIASESETTSDMAYHAAIDAIKDAAIEAEAIDMIIVATTTADLTFPATATIVQRKLGIEREIPAFDIQAVCSGFLYSLDIAEKYIQSGSMKNILVIGADKMSAILDFKDRSTAILFGDGAGAAILSSERENGRMLSSAIHSAGKYNNILLTSGGIGSNKQCGVTQMNGKEVFKHAVNKMASVIDEVLVKASLTKDDIDFMVPHQANIRIIASLADKLSLPMSKVVVTVDIHANTSAASIPLALDYAIKSGSIARGDKVLFASIGAGLSWGAMIIEY